MSNKKRKLIKSDLERPLLDEVELSSRNREDDDFDLNESPDLVVGKLLKAIKELKQVIRYTHTPPDLVHFFFGSTFFSKSYLNKAKVAFEKYSTALKAYHRLQSDEVKDVKKTMIDEFIDLLRKDATFMVRMLGNRPEKEIADQLRSSVFSC